MASISKAYHRLEHREMTVSEYESYLNEHPHWHSVHALRCIECGDEITFCSGDIKGSYFKHNPSAAGHSYCSLYHEGAESKTHESLIRKKLFREEDISLNFELRMIDGKWNSFITIPPFKNKEIEDNENNSTVLIIRDQFRRAIEKTINRENFSSGEIKRIGLTGFPSSICISITGKSSNKNISYNMEGFRPSKQLYSTLITQDYIDQNSSRINLSKIKTFACKRLSGRIYTGRHYFIFEDGYRRLKPLFSTEEAVVKEMVLPKDSSFNYLVYDIVFKKITSNTINFCESRDCELIEKSDAVILWPPINSIGNYKYFKNNKTQMFLSFERDDETVDMFTHTTECIFFKVDNINSRAFYVTVLSTPPVAKEYPKDNEFECSEIKIIDDKDYYSFLNGVLIKKIENNDYKLKKKELVLAFSNRLEIEKYNNPIIKTVVNNNYLLSLIRYSSKFVKFNKNEYEYLRSKYTNKLILDYLDSCIEYRKIKDAVKTYLMEEKI